MGFSARTPNVIRRLFLSRLDTWNQVSMSSERFRGSGFFLRRRFDWG